MLGLVAAAAVLLGGCGSDEADTAAEVDAILAERERQDRERIVAEASEEQLPYLADGVVTEAEREEAFFAYVDCMKQQGVEVTEYILGPDGRESISIDSEVLEGPAMSQVSEDCYNREFRAVGIVFWQQLATEDEDG